MNEKIVTEIIRSAHVGEDSSAFSEFKNIQSVIDQGYRIKQVIDVKTTGDEAGSTVTVTVLLQKL